ncbi:MAG: cobalamin-dependent protein [Clostridiales bacterium]|nr:cobalamin-dependent protein [Clostridiales bacterium]
MATVDLNSVFVRYDLKKEVIEKSVSTSKDVLLQAVITAVVDGDEDAIPGAVNAAFAAHDPMDIIKDGLVKGMAEVSRLWDEGVYFLPQTIISSDAMLAGIEICEEKMGKAMDKKGVVITHTAEGDIHDLGQKIVNALLRANGFEVVDLGKDVPVDDVISAVKKYKPVMVTGTALMTTTMTAFKKIASRLTHDHNELPFVCGGGAVSLEYVNSFDTGIWGKDAQQAPGMAEDAVSGKSWSQIREKYNG